MSTINFKIVTPEKEVYAEKIDQVTIDTKEGEITVLPHHMPLISILRPGEMRIVKDGKEMSMAVLGGFLEIKKDSEVIILADSAERAEDIDLEKAEEARKRAEELKKQKIVTSDMDYARVSAMLEKELARIKVARRHHKRRGMWFLSSS